MFTDCFYPRVNGVTVSVHSYATELAKNGHKICIVCPDYQHYSDLISNVLKKTYFEQNDTIHENIKILRVPAENLIWSKEDRMVRITQWRNIKKELDSFCPEVIHVNSEFIMGIYGAYYSRKRKLPLVFTFHTLWEDYLANYIKFVPKFSAEKLGRDLTKFYLKHANEVIVPTKRIDNVVKRYGIDKQTDIIPTGIAANLSEIKQEKLSSIKNELSEKFPGIFDGKILLYVGRVVKEKNLTFLFNVFEKLKQKTKNISLLFVGGGPELENLIEKAKNPIYENSIYFTNYRPQDELPYFYNLADVFVFPSLTETQGLVTIEAMTNGLPVVAIGEMGTYDVMQGDNGGFMVPCDEDIFTEKVFTLLTDETIYKEKSQSALEWSDNWKIEKLSKKLLQCYEKSIQIKKSLLQQN